HLARSEECFDIALDVVEIHLASGLRPPLLGYSRPVGETADAERLVVASERSRRIARILSAGEAQKAAGGLKNAHAIELARQVEAQVRHQTSHEARAHHI